MKDDRTAAGGLKALGHPIRLQIVRTLAERSCCCCADVCGGLPLAQSTVSQHLKVLRDADLVRVRRDGVRSSYVLNTAAIAELRLKLDEIASLAQSHAAASPVGGSR